MATATGGGEIYTDGKEFANTDHLKVCFTLKSLREGGREGGVWGETLDMLRMRVGGATSPDRLWDATSTPLPESGRSTWE